MIFLFVILLPIFSFAQNCSPVNFLTREDSPFEKIPVSDQDGTGICYAFSTSDLMNYHLIKTRQVSERALHPVWVALKASRRILYKGFERDAINAARTAGSCKYQNVEDGLNAFGMGSGLSGTPLVAFIETFFMEMRKEISGDLASRREDSFYRAQDVVAMNCEENIVWDLVAPKISELEGTSVQIFNRLLAQSCAPEHVRKYNIPAPQTYNVIDDQEALRRLNLISTGPLTFSYCASAWNSPEYAGQGSPRNTQTPLADCGDHSSLAVGRKKIGNECHMLVRNSWGTGWGDWNAGSKCICRHKVTREWVDECNYDDHNNGEYSVEACYINQQQLSRNLTSVSTL